MMYVLDTNTVSALMRGNPATVSRLGELSRQDVVLPQPVRSEIEYGIARLRRAVRKDALRERWALISNELGRVAWDDAVGDCFGAIKAELEHAGKLIEDFDIAIAAHALAWDGRLVSSDTKHFARIDGLALESWA